MACFHPLQAYQCSDGSVVFQELRGRDVVRSLQLPCGQCVGCRLERSRQWAIRCVHEAQMWSENCFITLTYGDEFTPVGGSLRYRDFQLFMRRLRKRFPGRKIRFFAAGEYGEEYARPHFHACLFNIDFADKVYWRKSESGSRIFRSAVLEALWPFGFSSVGAVSFESAAYVARYVMKKITGDCAVDHYRVVDVATGEVFDRAAEFCHMSLKPGIGSGWFERYLSDVYPQGLCVINGKEVRAPKYYDRKFAKLDDDGFAALSLSRDQLSRRNFADNSDARLLVKEEVTRARLAFLKRQL